MSNNIKMYLRIILEFVFEKKPKDFKIGKHGKIPLLITLRFIFRIQKKTTNYF
jgi:hypothetical protein